MNAWLLLILSLPSENATARMRAWRSLKASGAAVLRDGAYLLPERESCRATLNTIVDDVQSHDGSAHLLQVIEPAGANYPALFNRQDDYAVLLNDIAALSNALTRENAPDAVKQTRKLRKALAALTEIDYFPGEALRQATAALLALEVTVHRAMSPDEPHDTRDSITLLNPDEYRGRLWATRQRPWVDRLASAWLIQRFIDPEARFLWLAGPADCPADALGFDFDGATFSHSSGKVTFETLLASFDLDQPALNRIASIVHFLDVGGVAQPEAAGIEQVLAGMRDAITNDDLLLAAAGSVFDGLLTAFQKSLRSEK